MADHVVKGAPMKKVWSSAAGSILATVVATVLAGACGAADDPAQNDVDLPDTGAPDTGPGGSDAASDSTAGGDLEVHEVGPELSISPATLDFGWVAVGDSKTLELTVYNMGEHELQVSALKFADGSNSDLKLEEALAFPMVLSSGENHVFKVSFAPTGFFSTTSNPIGSLVVSSNDVDEGELPVLTYGNIDAPFIKLDPADKVDFGIVAQEWTIERTVEVTNVGHAPLVLSGVEVVMNTPDNEFALVPGTADNGEFAGEVSLDGGQSIVVRLAFTNLGPMQGIASARCKIVSNDPLTPEILLDVVATRGGQPECTLAFVPPVLEFGSVAHGDSKEATLYVKNVGSGACTWKSVIIRDCTSLTGTVSQCNASSGPSSMFKILLPPLPLKDGMAPGTLTAVPVRFTPPSDVPYIPMVESYNAWMQITYMEPYTTGQYIEHRYPEPNAQGTVNPNIHGTSGVANIALLPAEVDFGLTTVGCSSQTLLVKVHNLGTAPLQVTDIYLDGCGSQFMLTDYPQLPVEISPSNLVEVSAIFLPQTPGVDKCTLVVESKDLETPVARVELMAEGTWDTTRTEYHEPITGEKVDILFVVDESASMCDELDQLATSVEAMAALTQPEGKDVHVGITVTNVEADYTFDNGVSKAGVLLGDGVRYLTTQTIDEFPDRVLGIGCSGAGKQEAGLEAARRALLPPNNTDTDQPCSCGESQPCPGICPDYLVCVGGKCGGYNRGFLRHDAYLELVFISDEDDQSPGSVPFYVDVFKSIKGAWNTGMFRAHAIVGEKGVGCNGNSSDQNTGADGGDRYIAVQEETGGAWGSICDDDFGPALESIGQQSTVQQLQYLLGAHADPSSIEVWVDKGAGYEQCTSGWLYDEPSNSVVFEATVPCTPVAGDLLKISYDMSCFGEP